MNRLKKFLNRDAVVINPPIETSKLHYNKNGDFWLSVNRLLPPKRVDIQINAFAKLTNEKLIIVGSYEQSTNFLNYVKYLKQIKPKNVEIKSWVDQKELIELYANCKGFITTAIDEDFGMTPVEAMASGKPVIASNEGGYKETVINNKTGILIDNIDEYKLIEAIKKINNDIKINPQKYKKACQEQAKKFDIKVFIKKIEIEIENAQRFKK
jgi:glycosyltransferase involved in cell wall biosynthesis